MRKSLIAAAIIGTLSVPAIALAEDAAPAAPAEPAAAAPSPFTGNFTIASEYLYRGIAQTRGKPAIQGGFDYAHPSGFYVGTWGSNISWISDGVPGASASLEADIYGGYKSTVGPLGYDVGVLTYNYPGTGLPSGAASPNTQELYGALSWEWLTVKYSYTLGSLFGWTKSDGSKTTGSGYLEVNTAFDLGNGFALAGHVGHQTVKGFTKASYSDLKIGGTKDIGLGTVGLAYSVTNAKADCGGGDPYCFVNPSTGSTYDAGKGRLLLTFGKTF
jgi:uncharacterized protein (TIGR02001 family)